jgi:hypothetical protein
MKWSGVPFNHIYEWKICSPSSRSPDSSGWTFVVAMLTLGSTSMIHFPFSGLESDYESAYDPGDYFIAKMTIWSDIYQYCAKGFCGTCTTL